MARGVWGGGLCGREVLGSVKGGKAREVGGVLCGREVLGSVKGGEGEKVGVCEEEK